jgi:predicted extracellular nuclease
MEMKRIKKLPLFILTVTSCIVLESNAAIVINEFDYDQPGSDTAEFIELFNTGNTAVSLDDYTIKLINGSNASTYRTINLSGLSINTNEYFVICNDAGTVANCNYNFTSSSSWLQNGSPDAITLFENNSLLDSVSYEGLLSPYTEGDALTVLDVVILRMKRSLINYCFQIAQ